MNSFNAEIERGLGQAAALRLRPQIMFTDVSNPIDIVDGSPAICIAGRRYHYTWDMVSRFNSYFSSVEAEHAGGITLVDYSVPKWHVTKDTGERSFTSLAEGAEETAVYRKYLTPAVRMDVEGEECDIIEHDEELMRFLRARWFVEIHQNPQTREPPNFGRVRRIFGLTGYASCIPERNRSSRACSLVAYPLRFWLGS